MKWCLLVCGVLLSGCGIRADQGYIVHVEVIGPPAAFSGRTIEVEGMIAPVAVPKTGQADISTTQVTVCTRSRQLFLEQPVHVRILEAGRLLTDNRIERVACRLNRGPTGDEEWNTVYLEADGTLRFDFGNDPRAEATCYPPNQPLICRDPTF